MVKAEYDREKLIMKIKGHANAGNVGEDLICASVSMLAYTLAQNVQNLADNRKACNVNIILEEGEALIMCEPAEERESLLCVYDTIATGLALLQENYPQNVNFLKK